MAASEATPTVAAAPKRRRRWREIKKHRWHYTFLAPMIVLFVAFTVYPMIAGWTYAFFEWDGFGPLDEFVGWGNFEEAFNDPLFWESIRNTFAFTVGAIVLQTPAALLLALVLNNRRLTGRNLYRVLIFLPVVTTTAVVGIVFVVLLNPWAPGAVNEALLQTGFVGEAVSFLGDEATALPTLVLIDIWKDFGVIMIYWLAALQTIPKDLYESADLDGVNRWQRLRFITLPLVLPIAVIILLLVTLRSFNSFDIVWAMTEGGPNSATEIVQSYIYRYAFDLTGVVGGEPRFGFASAAAIIFGVMTMLIVAVQAIVVPKVRRMRADHSTKTPDPANQAGGVQR